MKSAVCRTHGRSPEYGAKRILLVGDAAGFVGLYGERINVALISGKLAAGDIQKELDNPETALSEYISSTMQLRERIKREHKPARCYLGTAIRYIRSQDQFVVPERKSPL